MIESKMNMRNFYTPDFQSKLHENSQIKYILQESV